MAALADAVRDASAEQGSAALTINAGGSQVGTGALVVGDNDSDLTVAWQQEAEQRDTVVVDETAYVAVAAGEPQWARIDPAAPAGTPSATLRYFAEQAITVGDPVRTLADQADAARIVNVEVDELDGREVTRYDIETDLVEMAEAAAEPADAELYSVSIRSGNDGISSSIWLDDNGLPARYDSELTSEKGLITLTNVVFTEWGEPVEVAAPESAAVVEAVEVSAAAIEATEDDEDTD